MFSDPDKRWRICWPCRLILAADSPLGWLFLREHMHCKDVIHNLATGDPLMLLEGGTQLVSWDEVSHCGLRLGLRLAFTPLQELGSVGLDE